MNKFEKLSNGQLISRGNKKPYGYCNLDYDDHTDTDIEVKGINTSNKQNSNYLTELLKECSKMIVDVTVTCADNQELESLVNVLMFIKDEIRGTNKATNQVMYRNERYTSTQKYNGMRVYDLVYDTKEEAEQVISRMKALINSYGLISVSDLCEMSNIVSSYADNKYGWTDLSNASVTRQANGYMLKIPTPSQL